MIISRFRHDGAGQVGQWIELRTGIGMNTDPYAPINPSGFDHLQHLLTVLGLWILAITVVTTAALLYWRMRSPETYARFRWRLTWEQLAKRCGLSVSEQVTKTDNEGKSHSRTIWHHPKLMQVKAIDHCLHLTVRTRMGLTVEDLEGAVPAIRDAAGAHSARSVVVAPGTVRIELVMREQLDTVAHASAPSSTVAVRSVRMGRCENGTPWMLTVVNRHTLTVGSSGAGEGSVCSAIAGGYGPAVAAGTDQLVRLIGIDLKYGIELSIGASLVMNIATTETEAVKTLAALEKLMDKRGAEMAGNAREHTPSTSAPLFVLLIDELAGVTAYMTDPALKKQAAASLPRILTKGRALGIVVVAFLQDPRKEILPMRGLFIQTIALRLRSRDEVAMVLGDGMADSAPAHRISPEKPGTGYVISEDGQVTKVRADYWTDDQIRTTAKKYGHKNTTGAEHE